METQKLHPTDGTPIKDLSQLHHPAVDTSPVEATVPVEEPVTETPKESKPKRPRIKKDAEADKALVDEGASAVEEPPIDGSNLNIIPIEEVQPSAEPETPSENPTPGE